MSSPQRRISISAIPNETLYTIVSNLSLQDRIALRSSNIREFGAPLNKSIRDDFAHHNDYVISAMFEAAGKRDAKMVRQICERGIGYAVRVDYYWYGCEKITGDGGGSDGDKVKERPGYFLLGQKPDDAIVDAILSIGPNLIIGESEGYTLSDIEQGMITTHSALSWSLKRNNLTKLQQFIEMDADPRLVIEMRPTLNKVDRQLQTAFDVLDCPNTGFMEPGEARRIMYQGIADNHFRYSLIEDMDTTFIWEGGNTLIHMATLCSNSIRMVKAVLSKGMDINARNDGGETALSLALSHKWSPPKLIRVLLENGADTSVTPYYLTDTMVFTEVHHEKIAVFLNYMGSDYRGGDGRVLDGDTLLHIAIQCEMPIKHVKGLLKTGLDVNAQNSEGKTALNFAASAASYPDVPDELEIVKLLKISGADETIKDKYGRTGFERDFEEVLTEYGADCGFPQSEGISSCTDGW